MSVVWAALVVVGFALIVGSLGLPDRANEVLSRARDTLDVLGDREMDDLSKERALRRHAARLFVLLWMLVGGGLLAIGLPLLGVWLLDLGGVASLESVLSELGEIDFLVGVTVVGGLAWLVIARTRRP